MTIQFKAQTLYLHPCKAIYWKEKSILFLADLHLGKAAHFRKKGLAAPSEISDTNFRHLEILLDEFAPERVLFLGDLFHSQLNNIWQKFAAFLTDYPHIQFELVEGNHDILPKASYTNAELIVHKEGLIVPPFILSHYPLGVIPAELYNLYGHVHPGVLLHGFGKQQSKFPCFHFGKTQAVLPAFGAFTGLALVQPKKGDRVFVIAEEEVIEVS
ncbi:MAG: ligase-associated DNA damage response endonuclease PdeM [Bacteroidota bacterium]